MLLSWGRHLEDDKIVEYVVPDEIFSASHGDAKLNIQLTLNFRRLLVRDQDLHFRGKK
jgi:hypothetical protein